MIYMKLMKISLNKIPTNITKNSHTEDSPNLKLLNQILKIKVKI